MSPLSRIVMALAPLGVFAKVGCSVDTTSVELVKERGYDLTVKTHVITGGDSGVGLGIATALAQANAKIIFLAHNVPKTQSLISNLSISTGNDKLSIIPINLFSLNSTKSAADVLLEQEDRIDVFIGDAGAVMLASFVTEDGFESVFQLEYLSHFYLVQRLLPKLRQSRGRVVFTGTAGIDPYDSIQGLCTTMSVPMGCEAIDRLSARVSHSVPAMPMVGSSGNVFFSLYLRVMLARQIALSEAGFVTAYSFHPGFVETPGTDGGFISASEIIVSMMDGILAGLVLGLLAGCVLCCKGKGWYHVVFWALFGTLLGGLVGYLAAGQWALVQNCESHPYWSELCNNPDGTAAQDFPLNMFQGAVSGVFLSAAPASELEGINGAQTVLCGIHPTDVAFDPYLAMLAKMGENATHEYLQALHSLSLEWVSEAAQVKLAESSRGSIVSVYRIFLVSGIALISVFLCSVTFSMKRRVACEDGSSALLTSGERGA